VSGTGVPVDGYVFYRYDDSNVANGLNLRVEIEMPQNMSDCNTYGRGLTIGTYSNSDPSYKVVLQNAECITDGGNEDTPTALVSKRYGESNYVQFKDLEDEIGTKEVGRFSESWYHPGIFTDTFLTG